MIDAGKPTGESWLVLERLELRLGTRIVVGHVRSVVSFSLIVCHTIYCPAP